MERHCHAHAVAFLHPTASPTATLVCYPTASCETCNPGNALACENFDGWGGQELPEQWMATDPNCVSVETAAPFGSRALRVWSTGGVGNTVYHGEGGPQTDSDIEAVVWVNPAAPDGRATLWVRGQSSDHVSGYHFGIFPTRPTARTWPGGTGRSPSTWPSAP